MAGMIVTQGLQRIAVQASQASSGSGPTYNAARAIQVMSIDDGAGSLAAGNTKANDPGAITNEVDRAFDATPARTSQTVAHISTFATTEGNWTIRKVLLHDDTAANVTTTSTTLVGGFDSQSIVGTTDFTKQFEQDITYSNV